ncbi:MAG: hypothetical protein M1376_15580 [Planctomycetes bacterium]|nr:hypothetical protein [Planctomycetota bacterium]
MMYYAIRTLWTGSGLFTVAVGAVGEASWEARLLVILSGVVTLLLSILLGGFVKHLAQHQEYNQSLQQRLNGQADRLFTVLEKADVRLDQAQTKEQCALVQHFFSQQLAEVNHKLDALLRRQPLKESQ